MALTPVGPNLGEVSIYLGEGNGTFRSAVQYLVPGADAVATGDFNGDGKLDLAVAENDLFTIDSKVAILIGNGDGTFQDASAFDVEVFPDFVAVADFNGDGKMDLAVACSSESVSILIGNGDGTFQTEVFYSVEGFPDFITVGDLNGDNYVDLIVANSDYGDVSVLLGNGNGTFQPPATILTEYNPVSVAVGHFDRDGILDLAVASQGGSVQIFRGNGNGTFQQIYTLEGNQPVSIATSDLNGDGILDLAVTYEDDTTGVLIGNGNGFFSPSYTLEPGGSVVAIADFNRDGAPDILVAPGAQFSILLGNGEGGFQTVPNYAVGRGPSAVASADFNRDGKPDLVVANSGRPPYTSNSVSVLLGKGNGSFQPQVQYSTGSQPSSVAVADVNNDGYLDIVTANSGANPATVSVLLGSATGTFLPDREVLTGSSSAVTFIATGDFNHDGRLDLALASDMNLLIMLGNGDGTFQSSVAYPVTGSSPGAISSIAIADVNLDGRLDVVANAGSYLEVFFGKGNGTFRPGVGVGGTGSTLNFISSVVAQDLNRDGKPDIAAVSPDGNLLIVFLGNGDGTFSPYGRYYVSGSLCLVAADLNGDGVVDLAAASRGSTSILLGNGDGTFAAGGNYASAGATRAVTAGDFNGDGKPDLAVADYQPANVSILVNTTR